MKQVVMFRNSYIPITLGSDLDTLTNNRNDFRHIYASDDLDRSNEDIVDIAENLALYSEEESDIPDILVTTIPDNHEYVLLRVYDEESQCYDEVLVSGKELNVQATSDYNFSSNTRNLINPISFIK